MSKLFLALMVAIGLAGCANMGMGGGPGGQPKRTVGEAVDDATIGTQLKAALAADPDVSALKAESLARGIKGVKSVDNQLLITG